ncbi:hypothetical protein [Sphingomonas sp. ID0503]|uniref:hypothetical protein n=1 Tax=Sphingomonas sp. ID0503 TaxID=3399691 RepID=UPI003AFB2A61
MTDQTEKRPHPAEAGGPLHTDRPADARTDTPGLGVGGAGSANNVDEFYPSSGDEPAKPETGGRKTDLDDPGTFAGTAGTGGDNKVQDDIVR